VAGFGFGVLWITEGIGAAILCLLMAGLGYGVVLATEHARANPDTFKLPSRKPEVEPEVEADDLPLLADELNTDLGHVYEPSDDASSPLAAEADYGWPTEEAELVHTSG
jgi:hypothetical protein